MQSGVLYVDDEINNLNSFKASFKYDFNIYVTNSVPEARRMLDNHEIGVIITDQRMPGITGVEFLESILPVYPDTVRILLTGFSDKNLMNDAINRGRVYMYLDKPWQSEKLKMDIKNALEVFYLRRENKILAYKLQAAVTELEIINKNGA